MKVVWTILAVVAAGLAALAIHIYVVTRPKPEGHSRGMARIDFRQAISQADADRITRWLYRQEGVDHVLVSAKTAIAVFTYAPLKTNAAGIANGLRDSLRFPRAIRYLPPAMETRGSCPMTASPLTKGIYQFLKRIF